MVLCTYFYHRSPCTRCIHQNYLSVICRWVVCSSPDIPIQLYWWCPQSMSPIVRSSQTWLGLSSASTYSIPPKCTAKTGFLQFLVFPSPLAGLFILIEGGPNLKCRRIAILAIVSRASRHTRYPPTIRALHPQVSPRIRFLPCASPLFD
jgi:hypothetical protein